MSWTSICALVSLLGLVVAWVYRPKHVAETSEARDRRLLLQLAVSPQQTDQNYLRGVMMGNAPVDFEMYPYVITLAPQGVEDDR